MNIIPDIILLDAYKNVLSLVRNDLKTKTDETQTLLYQILGTNKLQRYDLFEQAKTIFNDDVDNARKLDVNLFFNLKRQGIPTIHITLHSEESNDNGIGLDEGYQQPVYLEVAGDNSDSNSASDNVVSYNIQKVYNRRFDSSYNIFFTSDNTNEVLVTYHVLRALTIPLLDHLMMSGLENPKIKVEEVVPVPGLVPEHLFMRALTISFSYEVKGFYLYSESLLSEIIFDGTPVEN